MGGFAALGVQQRQLTALLGHVGRELVGVGQGGRDGLGPQRRPHLVGEILLDARQGLRRPLTEADVQAVPGVQARYTRTAQNEIYRQFHRLPNPDLVMYVFPHLAGTDPVPVPGYSTVFPLYQRVQYAMPGERVEDY